MRRDLFCFVSIRDDKSISDDWRHLPLACRRWVLAAVLHRSSALIDPQISISNNITAERRREHHLAPLSAG
jgi:hypothetical protein